MAHLVSFGSIAVAQRAYLAQLRDPARVLIVGGGAGRFLVDFMKFRHAHGERPQVLYLELSVRMLERARGLLQRELPAWADCVEFRHGSERELGARDGQFDALVTNFFFDLFDEQHAREVAATLAQALAPTGSWLLVDWTLPAAPLPRLCAKLLFRGMYGFFRVVSQVGASAPPNYDAVLQSLGFSLSARENFYWRMIQASLFARRGRPCLLGTDEYAGGTRAGARLRPRGGLVSERDF